MNCRSCNSSLAASQGKFCPFCGVENTQQFDTVVQQPAQQPMHQPILQPEFQPHFQQPEKKSISAWVIILVVAVIVFFLALCCVGSILLINNLDDSPFAATGTTVTDDPATDDVEVDGSNHLGIPSDAEILAFLEERHGVALKVEWSGRDDDIPALELRFTNQENMNSGFEVWFGDFDGNFFTLDEIKDGFLFALADSRIDAEMQLLAEDVFGAEMIWHAWADSHLRYSWHSRSLYQSVEWSPDEGMEAFRQAILNEMADKLHVSFAVMLNEAESIDDVSWEQVEELVERISASGYYGATNSLQVYVCWDSGRKGVDWRVQGGEVVSFERHDGQ